MLLSGVSAESSSTDGSAFFLGRPLLRGAAVSFEGSTLGLAARPLVVVPPLTTFSWLRRLSPRLAGGWLLGSSVKDFHSGRLYERCFSMLAWVYVPWVPMNSCLIGFFTLTLFTSSDRSGSWSCLREQVVSKKAGRDACMRDGKHTIPWEG